MGRFLFGITLILIGLVPLLKGSFAYSGGKYSEGKKGERAMNIRPVGLILVALGILFLAWSTVRIVPARSIGVEITFGRVTDTHKSGLHFVAPWSGVENYPSTIQTVRLRGKGSAGEGGGTCVTVRLGNQTTACVDVTSQWNVNTNDEEAVKLLYTRWRTFEKIETNLIMPQLQHALLGPFEKYDPLRVLQTATDVTPTAQLEAESRGLLEKAVGSGVVINNLTINLVAYDPTTQDKLNAYAQALADTRIAGQREQTAQAQRRANEALAGSGASRDAGVLYQNCIDMTERLAKEGKPLPAAWSCGAPPTAVVNVR